LLTKTGRERGRRSAPEAYLDRVVAPQVVAALDGATSPPVLGIDADRVVVRR
jgi:hypothetical protein